MRESTALPKTSQPAGRLWDGKSGNHDMNRKPVDIIVMHTMEGSTAGSTAWFRNPVSNGGAQYGISLDGTITQWMPETAVAYHAGNYSINQRSIAVEHEDLGKYNNPRPDALYESSARLVADIALAHGIPIDRAHIILHKEVSDPKHPGHTINKACPGTLDVDRIVKRALEISKGSNKADETLVAHFMPPSVFALMVTKSTNWDDYCAGIGMPPETAKNAGVGKQMANQYNARLQAEITPGAVPTIQATPDVTPSSLNTQVPNMVHGGTLASTAQNDVWQKDVATVLGELLRIFSRSKKAT